jgi:hypothetical protein
MNRLKVIIFCVPLLLLDLLIPMFTDRTFEDENAVSVDALKHLWNKND